MKTTRLSQSCLGAPLALAVALLLPTGCLTEDEKLDELDETEEFFDDGETEDTSGPTDPTSDLVNYQWSDQGPLAEDEHSDLAESVEADYRLAAAPRFQLPFRCGQVWAGRTSTGHKPLRAVDFNRANDIGDSVRASAAGRVTRVENTGSDSYGRWIEISHGNGYTTRYAHLLKQRVSVGQVVKKGQKIGNVGSTGGSSGPHLHYEQRHNSVSIPARFNGVPASYYTTRNYTSRNKCKGSAGAPGQVNTSGAPLTVRKRPTTSSKAVGSLADGSHVTIRCQKNGQRVSGTYGTTKIWDKVGSGFISDAFVYTGTDGRVAKTCE